MIQTGEIIIIALLALVVLGPSRLPDMARKMGRWTMELRNAARDMTRGLESEVQEFKQAGEELRAPMNEVRDEVKKPFTEIRDEVSGFGRGGHEWKGPKPVSGPTPEDAMRDLEEMNRGVDEEPDKTSSPPSPEDAPLPGSAGTPPDRPAASPSPSPEDAPLPGSAGTPPDGPSALGGETDDTSPDASLGEETGPSALGGETDDTSSNASLGEETGPSASGDTSSDASQGEETGDTDETRE